MEPPPQGEVEDTLKRINSHPGVLGLLVINPQGIAIRSTMDNATTQLYATNFQHLASLARSCVRDLDPLNDLKFLRVRSRKNEIMVAPSKDYTLIVIQNPNHRDVWYGLKCEQFLKREENLRWKYVARFVIRWKRFTWLCQPKQLYSHNYS